MTNINENDMLVTLEEFVQKICDVEGVNVGISAPPDKKFRPYRYERCARGNMTVTELIARRIMPSADGYNVEIFGSDGNKIHGLTKLTTARNK